MILSIWVFFILGDPTPDEPGTAYVQHTASPFEHDYAPELVESDTWGEYYAKYPGHRVNESGWRKQEVTVMGG